MSEAGYDLLVIGGGPGGYVAAIRGAQLGLRTALVEREQLGGICANWGCIPTKALLHVSALHRQIRDAEALGLRVGEVSFDLEKLVARSRGVAVRMSQGVRHLLKKNRVTLYEGEARIAGPGQVSVVAAGGGAPVTLRATHTVLATGARAREIPGLPVDGERVWNYRHALAPTVLPDSLLVIGAGAIGMEFASLYNALGSRVTVVEAKVRVLPMEDEEVSAFVAASFEKQGIAIRTGVTVAGLERGSEGLTVSLRSDTGDAQVSVSHVLVAIGVTGNCEELGLDLTAVKIENGHIVVGAGGRTGEPGLYAIGDVAGAPWLAHKASHEAVLCVEQIASGQVAAELDASRIPACTYCHPQVASIGLTETQARAAGHEPRVGRFPFAGNGKAIAIGEPEGFVKTVFDGSTGELLGAHLVGPDVTELIHGFSLARTLEATEAELIETIYPHPTLSEAAHESVLAACERALHI
ncbi:MAG: dihydrolipoyl dehydrogenase [Burkholderiaceae bacterium]